MNAHHHFLDQLARRWPVEQWSDVTVVVAVSGGPDSVALVRALADLQQTVAKSRRIGKLVAAHFNHQLRGVESDADASFVSDLSDSLAVPCEIGVPDGGGSRPPASEEGFRDARFRFLGHVAGRYGARFLVTAHTADDQAETILHHILRGTGLAGLAGIPAARPLSELTTLVRPLLAVTRESVLQFLADIGQPYRCDATNLEACFTRNRLRLELLPQLRDQYNPHIADALRRLGRLAGAAQQIVDARVQTWYERSVRLLTSGRVEVDCLPLAGASAYEVAELLIMVWKQQGWPLQAMDHNKWSQLASWARSESDPVSSVTFPGGIQVSRNDRHLLFDAGLLRS